MCIRVRTRRFDGFRRRDGIAGRQGRAGRGTCLRRFAGYCALCRLRRRDDGPCERARFGVPGAAPASGGRAGRLRRCAGYCVLCRLQRRADGLCGHAWSGIAGAAHVSGGRQGGPALPYTGRVGRFGSRRRWTSRWPARRSGAGRASYRRGVRGVAGLLHASLSGFGLRGRSGRIGRCRSSRSSRVPKGAPGRRGRGCGRDDGHGPVGGRTGSCSGFGIRSSRLGRVSPVRGRCRRCFADALPATGRRKEGCGPPGGWSRLGTRTGIHRRRLPDIVPGCCFADYLITDLPDYFARWGGGFPTVFRDCRKKGRLAGCRTAIVAVQAASRHFRCAAALRAPRRRAPDAVHPWP